MLRAGPKCGSGHELYVATTKPIERKENCGECQNDQGNQDMPESSLGLEMENGKKGESGNKCYDDPIGDQELAEIGNDRVAHAEYKEDLKPKQNHSDRVQFASRS